MTSSTIPAGPPGPTDPVGTSGLSSVVTDKAPGNSTGRNDRAASSAANPLLETAATKPRRVLIVDDNDTNRKLASVCAARLGWQVSEESSGQGALDALGAAHFEALLLDINMPDIGGEQVLARLLATPAIKPERVIAYTAHAMPEHDRRFRQLGFDELLIKPITLAALEAALGRA